MGLKDLPPAPSRGEARQDGVRPKAIIVNADDLLADIRFEPMLSEFDRFRFASPYMQHFLYRRLLPDGTARRPPPPRAGRGWDPGLGVGDQGGEGLGGGVEQALALVHAGPGRVALDAAAGHVLEGPPAIGGRARTQEAGAALGHQR